MKIGKVTFRKAKEYLRKLESRHANGKLGLIDVKPITFDKYSVLYLNYSKANNASGSLRLALRPAEGLLL